MPDRVPKRDASRLGAWSEDGVPGRGVLSGRGSTYKPDGPHNCVEILPARLIFPVGQATIAGANWRESHGDGTTDR